MTEVITPMDPPRKFSTVDVTYSTRDSDTVAGQASQTTTAKATTSPAITEGFPNSFDTATMQPRSQETAEAIVATLPESAKRQSIDVASASASAEKSHPSSVTRDHQAPCDSSVTSGIGYNTSQHLSPEMVASVFPSELPLRPPHKRSFLQRLHDPSSRAAQADKGASHDHNHRTPDIEMNVRGEDPRPHDMDRSRRLKFWGLMSLGAMLSMMVGAFVYYLLTQVEVRGAGGGGTV